MHPRPLRGAASAAVLLLVVAGCASSTARPEQPLDPEALLASVRSARESASPTNPLTLAEAVARMRGQNPAIREARAAWQAAQAIARVRTPQANPTLSLGPLLLGGADILSAGATGFAAGLGWAVPLNNARALQDDINRVRADAALARAAGVERETYLAVRRDFAATILEQERAAARLALGESATAAVEVGRQLAQAGQATAVDVRLLDLDAERAHADALAAQGTSDAQRHALAARIGTAARSIMAPDGSALPALPSAVPAIAEIEAVAVQGNPALSVIRAEYVVAEKALRLQVAESMPDFEIGGSIENEDGALTLGLPFSIELPLWDRNQVGITEACAHRSEVRVRYSAALQRLLADIASARARLVAARGAHEALVARVQPASTRTLAAARASLDAGSIDALRYLEVLRAEREVAVDVIAARIAVFAAWSDLEDAAGVPLLRFPGEPHAGTAPAAVATEEE